MPDQQWPAPSTIGGLFDREAPRSADAQAAGPPGGPLVAADAANVSGPSIQGADVETGQRPRRPASPARLRPLAPALPGGGAPRHEPCLADPRRRLPGIRPAAQASPGQRSPVRDRRLGRLSWLAVQMIKAGVPARRYPQQATGAPPRRGPPLRCQTRRAAGRHLPAHRSLPRLSVANAQSRIGPGISPARPSAPRPRRGAGTASRSPSTATPRSARFAARASSTGAAAASRSTCHWPPRRSAAPRTVTAAGRSLRPVPPLHRSSRRPLTRPTNGC